LHFLLGYVFASSYVCFPNVKKLRTITRAIAMLLFTAAWLAASTASLLHDVLHHGVLYHSGAHGSASHYHGQKSWGAAITVAQVDAADTHPAYSSLSVCFFCLNGPLTLALAAVAMLVSLPQFFRFGPPLGRHRR